MMSFEKWPWIFFVCVLFSGIIYPLISPWFYVCRIYAVVQSPMKHDGVNDKHVPASPACSLIILSLNLDVFIVFMSETKFITL